jgi:hypothetical protein
VELLLKRRNRSGIGAPYSKPPTALDDLDSWHLLKPDIRSDLDLLVWASAHGMATLLVEGAVPPESVDAFIDSMTRLVLIDGALSAAEVR